MDYERTYESYQGRFVAISRIQTSICSTIPAIPIVHTYAFLTEHVLSQNYLPEASIRDAVAPGQLLACLLCPSWPQAWCKAA